jgi:hypothetical protein
MSVVSSTIPIPLHPFLFSLLHNTESYYAIAVKSLSSGTNNSTSASNTRQRKRGGAATSTSGTLAELALEDLTVRDANEMDVWLAEMKYRSGCL